jgi:hypothetical protein
VKVFFFHPETGVYQGEGYEIDRPFSDGEGITTVSPPVWEKGMIPVFDRRQAVWFVVSISETASRIAAVRSRPGRREG